MGAKAYFRIPGYLTVHYSCQYLSLDPWVAVTKKQANTTRGGGKGRIIGWVSPVRGKLLMKIMMRILTF